MGAILSGHWQNLFKVASSHFSCVEVFVASRPLQKLTVISVLDHVRRGPRRAVLVAEPRCREAGRSSGTRRVAQYAEVRGFIRAEGCESGINGRPGQIRVASPGFVSHKGVIVSFKAVNIPACFSR